MKEHTKNNILPASCSQEMCCFDKCCLGISQITLSDVLATVIHWGVTTAAQYTNTGVKLVSGHKFKLQHVGDDYHEVAVLLRGCDCFVPRYADTSSLVVI